MKRIAILGEIGSGNLGDDYGYILLRDELIAAFRDLDVIADIRPLTPNLNWMLSGYHWDAVVTGVGTLLDMAGGAYVRELRNAAEKCPIAILGSGVSDTRHFAATAEGRALFAEVMAKARHAWLRKAPDGYDDKASGPDPVWLHGWHKPSKRSYVGINVGFAGFSTLNLDPEFLSVVRETRPLLRHPSRLFAAWTGDNGWLNRIKRPGDEQYMVNGCNRSLAPLSECRSLLATRIHLAVLAACHGCYPVLPDYAGKVREVFGWTDVPFKALPTTATPHDYARELHADRNIGEMEIAVKRAQATVRLRVRSAARAIAEAW